MPAITYIDLIDMARSQSFGPVRADSSLIEFGETLGAPRLWGGFLPGDPLCCYMIFGAVEIGFYSKNDLPLVRYAELHTAKFEKKEVKFARDRMGNEIRIKNPFDTRFPTFENVALRMDQEKLSYTTEYQEAVLPDTGGVMNFGQTLHFYFNEQMRLEVVSIAKPDDDKLVDFG